MPNIPIFSDYLPKHNAPNIQAPLTLQVLAGWLMDGRFLWCTAYHITYGS